MTFPLRRRGSRFPSFAWIAAGVLTVGFLLLTIQVSVLFLFAGDPGPGEPGRTSFLGFALTFASFTYFLGSEARRGVPLALASYRWPGEVTIRGDILRIDAPGIVTVPLDLHRSWVSGADRPKRAGGATSFTLRAVGEPVVVHVERPLGIPQATSAPTLPKDLARPPKPSDAVWAIALDPERPDEVVEAINRWANETAGTSAPKRPPVAPKDDRRRNRNLVALSVLVVSLGSTFFTLPS